METPSLNNMIKRAASKVFRRAYIKRRQLSDGLFEADWLEITRDVKYWGQYKTSIDVERQGLLRFNSAKMRVSNVEGRYNPNDNEFSLWDGYADQQRSLVKIEAGFIHQTLGSNGIWTSTEFPSNSVMFIGIISGNVFVSGKNEVALPIQPLNQIFRDYPASLVDGFTTTGISAGGWFALLRDQTDGSGEYVFRPYVGDGTTTDWSIASAGHLYSNLNTSTAEDLRGLDCWEVSERLAESENMVPYFTREGKFVFREKAATTTSTFEFYGLGFTNRTYGHTIKDIFRYGKKLTKFYSRVAVKYVDEDTNTSFVNTGLAYAISGTNTAWNLGHRTFEIQNFWIPNSAAAASIASAVFADVSSLNEEINFSTTLITHLSLLDRVKVSYNAIDISNQNSLWDLNDWAPDPVASQELYWDPSRGDAILLDGVDFQLISIDINLDKLETRYIAKQL